MRRILPILVAAIPVIPTHASGQQWSSAQSEVWQNVEAYWDLYAQEDLAGFLSYFHEDFSGWSAGDPVPTTKSDRAKGMPRAFATSNVVFYQIKPVAIRVHSQVAIVHYFFWMTLQDPTGEESSTQGHWTDVLMRQGDRWVMIGDAGGTADGD